MSAKFGILCTKTWIFLTALACSGDFLSGIFGFSMKFHVDIGGRKTLSRKCFRKKSIEKSPKNREMFDFFQNSLIPEKYFWRLFGRFFFRKKSIIFFRPPMSTWNFMVNPKITLRKSTEQAKAVKNQKSKFWYTEFRISVTFGDVLCITTLKDLEGFLYNAYKGNPPNP